MLPISDISDLIGVPFNRMKCWDVVVEVYRRSGVSLPNYTEIHMGDWEEIREPLPMSVLAFALYGHELDHVGVYLGEGTFIHATEHAGVCIEHIAKYVPRLKHIYEWKGVQNG